MGKEMICPLCRFLHKDQPFMGPEEVSSKSASPTSTDAAAAAAAAATSIASVHAAPPNLSTVNNGRNRHQDQPMIFGEHLLHHYLLPLLLLQRQ
ncbi:hypothetical protein FBU30_003041 [Linnemannia zychae]|nr:hypothetical protein FBU30_003041 [Linnemannia zychae]